jgi:hypothetical protein
VAQSHIAVGQYCPKAKRDQVAQASTETHMEQSYSPHKLIEVEIISLGIRGRREGTEGARGEHGAKLPVRSCTQEATRNHTEGMHCVPVIERGYTALVHLALLHLQLNWHEMQHGYMKSTQRAKQCSHRHIECSVNLYSGARMSFAMPILTALMLHSNAEADIARVESIRTCMSMHLSRRWIV